MCLEKYLNRLKGDYNYVLINIEIEGMMQKKKLEFEFPFVWKAWFTDIGMAFDANVDLMQHHQRHDIWLSDLK